MAKNIMIQGTASSVGKSILTAALCRVFKQDGHNVAPFKSQNMALNSFVTREGLEMGRAQVVQAEACGLEPSVLMNPVLLKPTGDTRAQVVIKGKVFKNLTAAEYHDYKPEIKSLVEEVYRELETGRDIIVIEGAGSPAEINLRDKDIVNMGMAELVDSPVLLVADIDKGGVFASIVGTIVLLDEEERKRIKGVIINKFRGDLEILKPGIDMLEEKINIPVLGVLPWLDIKLEDEDSVSERFRGKNRGGDINIAVIRFPHISNYTDFDVFDLFDDVNINYAARSEDVDGADIIILPGSKNTIGDLLFMQDRGLDKKIADHHKRGTVIIGICGGYQMLGDIIEDPHGVEGNVPGVKGLGILAIRTVLQKEKTTTRVRGRISCSSGLLEGLDGIDIDGYEIHMGDSISDSPLQCLALIDDQESGVVQGNVMGTYVHGIFDNTVFTRGLLNNIRVRKGLPIKDVEEDFKVFREREFDKLADVARSSLDMEMIYKILDGETLVSA